MLVTSHEDTGPHYSTLALDQEARLPAGTRLQGGELEVVEELARGGMSVVYRAIDHLDAGRVVALKVVIAALADSDIAIRFHNEARLGAALADHPHMVRPLRVGRLDGPAGFEGRVYLVSELVEGCPLDEVMGVHRVGLEAHRACRIARDVAHALVALHARGIVHRDIKPGNVVLTREQPERAKLIDFGLACANGDGWTESAPDPTGPGHASGTLVYMSPQQVAHARPAPSMDIYALGVMLYELFAGNPPFHRLGVVETLARKCDSTRPPFPLATMCPELDTQLWTLVHQCLAYEPSARPDAAEVVRVLEDVLGISSGARRSRRWLAVLAATGALVLGGVTWGLLREPAAVAVPRPDTGSPAELRPDVEPPVSAIEPPPPPPPDDRPASPQSRVAPPLPTPPPPDDPPPRRKPSVGRKPSPRPARPPRVSPPVEAPPNPCPKDTREAARLARDAHDWHRVIQGTSDASCWDGAREERVVLRTRALFESERYAECARIGQHSKNHSVMRWVRICQAHAQEEKP